MKIIISLLLFLLIIQLTGCIIIHTVSYEVNVNEDGTGKAIVKVDDINTDSKTEEVMQEDANNVLEYGLKSQEWLDGMEAEGKKVVSRNLIVEDGKLNAVVSYEFSDISTVEGMQFEDPYFYLTILPEDSIISTNGQVTKNSQYQRIIWDKSIKTIKFKMYSDDTSKEGLTSLTKFYLKEK